FIGTVSMSTGTPSGINGLTAFLSSNSVSLLPGSTVTDSLTIATTQFTPSGTYSITVTGSSGSLSHTVSVIVTVNPDFPLSAHAASNLYHNRNRELRLDNTHFNAFNNRDSRSRHYHQHVQSWEFRGWKLSNINSNGG